MALLVVEEVLAEVAGLQPEGRGVLEPLLPDVGEREVRAVGRALQQAATLQAQRVAAARDLVELGRDARIDDLGAARVGGVRVTRVGVDARLDGVLATQRATARLCDALVAIDLLRKSGDRYANTPAAGRYVVASFKETQVGRMRPGQDVDVEVEAYPDVELRAKVDGIAAGTGSRFSLRPADDATGNFVKVVQRVPVRILLSDVPSDVQIEPGMSLLVDGHVR